VSVSECLYVGIGYCMCICMEYMHLMSYVHDS